MFCLPKEKEEGVPSRAFAGAAGLASCIFVDPSGDFTNDRHEHLLLADIGVLWTSVPNSSKGKRVLAQAESPFPRGDKWSKGRQLWQLEQWFGTVPDFVLTFDANWALEADDWAFCAVCEHELCHCAQRLDADGCPRVNEETGKALFLISGTMWSSLWTWWRATEPEPRGWKPWWKPRTRDPTLKPWTSKARVEPA